MSRLVHIYPLDLWINCLQLTNQSKFSRNLNFPDDVSKKPKGSYTKHKGLFLALDIHTKRTNLTDTSTRTLPFNLDVSSAHTTRHMRRIRAHSYPSKQKPFSAKSLAEPWHRSAHFLARYVEDPWLDPCVSIPPFPMPHILGHSLFSPVLD